MSNSPTKGESPGKRGLLGGKLKNPQFNCIEGPWFNKITKCIHGSDIKCGELDVVNDQNMGVREWL